MVTFLTIMIVKEEQTAWVKMNRKMKLIKYFSHEIKMPLQTAFESLGLLNPIMQVKRKKRRKKKLYPGEFFHELNPNLSLLNPNFDSTLP